MTFIYTWTDILLLGLIVFFIGLFAFVWLADFAKKKIRIIKLWWSKPHDN